MFGEEKCLQLQLVKISLYESGGRRRIKDCKVRFRGENIHLHCSEERNASALTKAKMKAGQITNKIEFTIEDFQTQENGFSSDR